MPLVIPIDPPGEGGSMLLLTLRGFGGYGDDNDFTYGTAELPPPNTPTYMRVQEARLAEVKLPDNVEISHIIIHARACVGSRQPLNYSQSAIVYGTPVRRINVQDWPVSDNFDFATRSTGPLTEKPGGGPWTFPDIFAQLYGVEVHWNGLSFVPGEFLHSEVWVDVYGRENDLVRRRKFIGGDYRLFLKNRTHIATLTADEIRQVYEAARGTTDDGKLLSLSLMALRLDNGAVSQRDYKVNSSLPLILVAIEEAKQPDIG